MSDRLTLYYRPGACALAPHVVLNWIGVAYDAINAPRDDSYRKINPNGAVPALVLPGGKTLTQAGAILQVLAEQFDRSDLLGGADIEDRCQVLKWMSFMTGDFHPAFFPVFVPGRYTTGDRAAQDAVKLAGLDLVRSHLETIETHLNGRDVFVGSRFTLADAYALPMLRWAKRVLPEALENSAATARLYSKLLQDDGVIAAMRVHAIEG